MPRSKRGTCVGCGARRVLYGSICRECMDQEDFGQKLMDTLRDKPKEREK